jgi:hypothetical protein
MQPSVDKTVESLAVWTEQYEKANQQPTATANAASETNLE